MTLSTFCTDKNTPCWDTCGNTPWASQRQLWLPSCSKFISGFSVFHQQVSLHWKLKCYRESESKSAKQSKLHEVIYYWQKRELCVQWIENIYIYKDTRAHAPCEASFWCAASFKSHRWFEKSASQSLWSHHNFSLLFLATGQPTYHVAVQPERRMCVFVHVPVSYVNLWVSTL